MYRFMDEEEIQINKIDQLKMIHIYDLAGAGMGTSQTSSYLSKEDKGQEKHVTALAVYYGENGQKNLCIMDKNYPVLVERVLYLYSRATDKDFIIMDADTRKLMDEAVKGFKEEISPLTKFSRKYLEMDGEELPRINSHTYIRLAALPMIKYYLTELYSMLEVDIQFKEDEIGWHGNSIIRGIAGGKDVVFPVRFSYESWGSYTVYIGNFLKERCSIIFNVSYKEQSMQVDFISEDAGITGQSIFDFEYNGATTKTSIAVNDTTVFYQDMALEEIDAVDVIDNKLPKDLLGLSKENLKVYQLPWEAYYVMSVNSDICDDIQRLDFDMGYVEFNGEIIFVRQSGYSYISNTKTGLKIKTNGVKLERIVDKRDSIIQTSFSSTGYDSNWDYKNNLENKYFCEEIKEK